MLKLKVFSNSSPACTSLKSRHEMFIYHPHKTQHQQNRIRTGSGFGQTSTRGRLKASTRAPASRRSPAGFHAGACNLSVERVDFYSKSADFHARVPEVDSKYSHGVIMMKNNYQSKLYPEMQKHSKTRQKHTNA